MVKLGNVVTPFTGVAVAVPPSIPEEGLLPMAMVIELVAPGTTLPLVSSTATCTEGIIEAPAFVLVGCTRKASLFAGRITLNAVLTAGVKPVAAAFSV